jgi:hypothetical protein
MNLRERADSMILELKWILELSIPRLKYEMKQETKACKKKKR